MNNVINLLEILNTKEHSIADKMFTILGFLMVFVNRNYL